MVGRETDPKAVVGASGIGRDQHRGLAHHHGSAQRRAGHAMSLGALSVLLLAMASGLAVGQLHGGDLDRLRAARIKALPLAVAALVLQVLLGLQALRLDGALRTTGSVLLVASLLVALIVVWANRRLPGMLLLGLGLWPTCWWSASMAACRCPRRPWSRPGSPRPAPGCASSARSTSLSGPEPAWACWGHDSPSPRAEPCSALATSPSTPALCSWSRA